MVKMNLPKRLTPNTEVTMKFSDGCEVLVPKTSLLVNSWKENQLFDTFGGKAVLEDAGGPTFAELLVYRYFRKANWSARWIVTYGSPRKKPRYLTEWVPQGGLKTQVHQPIQDASILKALDSIVDQNGNQYSGCWDVVAWRDKKIVFAELKRKGHDKIQRTQLMWIQNALKVGFSPKNFLLVEWDFRT